MFEGTLLAVVDRQKLIFQNCYDQRIEKQRIHMHTVLNIRHNSCKDDHPFLPSFLSLSSLALHSISKGDYQKLP
jgi:UDP-galactopyranose mutase